MNTDEHGLNCPGSTPASGVRDAPRIPQSCVRGGHERLERCGTPEVFREARKTAPGAGALPEQCCATVF